MRKISTAFLRCLKTGFLSEITEQVKIDPDLNLEIRAGYINIYFKGNSLLNLAEAGSLLHYKAQIDNKFLEGVDVSLDFTEDTTPQFIKNIPFIKENIIRCGRRSLEIEYEQMIIRANNFEPRNNTEYFIVDRQYAIKEGRFDLTGIYWDRHSRGKHQQVPVCLMEIKFALNRDIQEVQEQLAKYYEPIKKNASAIAEEMETVFKQKLSLGLYKKSVKQINAMKTLSFSRDIKDFQFIVVLVDYNPNSSLFALEKIKKLPFANQIKVFHAGFGMWNHNVSNI